MVLKILLFINLLVAAIGIGVILLRKKPKAKVVRWFVEATAIGVAVTALVYQIALKAV